MVMDNPWLLLLPLLFLSSALAFISKTIFQKKPHKNLPPGPPPLPIIGNLNLIALDPRRSLHSIMLLHFGKFPVVVASSSDMARQLLKVHDAVFASRPALASGKYTAYEYKNSAWAPYGPHWINARKIYHMEVFNDKKMDSFEHIRVEERRILASSLFAQSGETILLKDHLSKYTLSVICRMLLTKKYFVEFKRPKRGDLENMLEELLALNIGDWIPWLNFLDLQGCVGKMRRLQERLDRFHEYVIADHEARRAAEKDGFKPMDLIDVLLEKAEDPNLEVKVTRDHIKGQVQDLLNGGTDTTSKSIEWAIRETLGNPEVAEKAKAELDRVIGRDRWVEEKDLSQLSYIDAILMESLRMHPLATFLTYHYSIDDCEVGGYHIPKGTNVLIDVWSIARDPSSWDSPNEFLPERFLAKDVDILSGGNYALLPFASGRRRCPGLSLLRITFANLVHGFEMRLGEGVKAEDVRLEEMEPKVPLAVVMEPRLPHHLY